MLEKESLKPVLNRNVSVETFEAYYWLKSELQNFCKQNGLKVSGSKEFLNKRICSFLNSDREKISAKKNTKVISRTTDPLISITQRIGCDFIFGRE